MDNDDYVETSDPEELEVTLLAARSSSRQRSIVPEIAHDILSPKKKRKLTHEGGFSQHSTPLAEASISSLYALITEGDSPESSSPKQVDSDANQSHDELDVISQRQRTLSLERHIPTLSEKGYVSNVEASARDESIEPSLFTPPQTPVGEEQLPSQHSSCHSSPLSSPILRNRFSSLPPSSPAQQRVAPQSSQKARSHSPIPSPSRLQQVVVHPATFEPSIPDHSSDPTNDHETVAGLTHSRYSFRSRKPQQERPYAYDLQLYRGQMRNAPEAIVAAPRHDDQGEGHHHRVRHSHDNATQDDDFIVPDDKSDEESQVPLPKKSVVHEGAHKRATIRLPESMQMSDDDDLPDLGWSIDGSVWREKDAPLKVDQRRKRFPLHKPRERTLQLRIRQTSDEPERPQTNAIRFENLNSRRLEQSVDLTSRTEDEDLGGRATSQATSPTVAVVDADDFGPLYSDDLPQPYDPSPPMVHNAVPEELSSDEETKLASGSDEEVLPVLESEDMKKQRKRMKAMSRMMPAVMMNKLLGQRAPAKPARKRTATPSGGESESENSSDLAPGKSKRLRKEGTRNVPVEIRGDTESSDSTDDSDQDASERSESYVSDVSGDDDRAQDEAIEAGWLDHDSSRRYAAPRFKRNEDLIDRMLTRTRSTKPRVRTSGGGRPRSKRPKNPSLDIVIPAPSRNKSGRQTRLPFRPEDSLVTYNSEPNEVHDLTRSDPPSPSEGNAVNMTNAYWKMSKKERRRQMLLKQTYIVPSDGRLVTSGRKTRLRIDLNDDAIHDALAPLHRADTKPRIQTANNRHVRPHGSAKRHRISARHNPNPSLRQTVLTEFEAGEDVDDFGYHEAGPVSSQALPHVKDDGWHRSCKLTVDFGIKPFPVGLAFGPNTYIGKQLLRDLIHFITDGSPPDQPGGLFKFDITFSPGISVTEYTQNLDKVADVLCERLLPAGVAPAQDNQDFKEYELLMYNSSRYLGWLLSKAGDGDRRVIYEATENCMRRITQASQSRLDSTSTSAGQAYFEPLSILWFTIETTSRALAFGSRMGDETSVAEWKGRVLLLLRFLLSYGLEDILKSISSASTSLDGPSDNTTVAGLWVCLIHLLPAMFGALKEEQGSKDCVSSYLLEVVQDRRHSLRSDLEYSDYIWRTIFSLCALSQFSVNGNSGTKFALSPCWSVVVAALSTVRLTHEPSVDQARARSTLRARDRYVHVVVSRCYMLCARWKWSLADAHVMIDKLISVFKSRKYSDLLGEIPDFPAFVRHLNLQLLKQIRRNDSAFCIVLKVIALAVVEDERCDDGAQRVSNKLRRLLSLFMPNGKVPFTKESPPSSQELSMLYNRYSSVIIAIYLERSASSLKGRIEQARRYVDFPNLDSKSKQACIRAAMNITILVQHLKLPLDEPLKWLEDMTHVLLTEYRESTVQTKVSHEKLVPAVGADQGRAVLCLQLLLGSIRRVIETPSMDPEAPITHAYPDVGLLSGPWVKDIFSTKTLTSIVTTGIEIQRLVQAFLDARAKVIQLPRLPVVVDEESQESQDYFADYDDEFDYNDPDLQAILDRGNNAVPSTNNNRQSDATVAEIMDTDVTPAIYRLVMQHFQDPSNSFITEGTIDEFYKNTDRWVDCWVGCAAVVVQNERRTWSYYLEMGSQSWTGISDPSLRRRVGLRFMHRLLQLDPPAYRSNQDAFLKVLMESLVTFRVTLEGEYVALLFSIDGLHHGILRDMPVERSGTGREIQFQNTRFSELRAEIIAGILSNLNEAIIQEPADKVQSHYDIQTWIGLVLYLFSTMRDVHETLANDDARTLYAPFCRRVLNQLISHPRLLSQPRFSIFLTWARARFGLPAT